MLPLTSKSEKKIYFYGQMFDSTSTMLITMQFMLFIFYGINIYLGTGVTSSYVWLILLEIFMIIGTSIKSIIVMSVYTILKTWIGSKPIFSFIPFCRELLKDAAKETSNHQELLENLLLNVFFLFFSLYFFKTMFSVVYYAVKLRYWTKKEQYDEWFSPSV